MNAPQAPTEPSPGAETPAPPAPAPEVAAASPEVAAAPPPPEPEPWTPARVLAWNAYYDLYVAAGVLLLSFLTSAVRVGNSAIWSHLRAGQLILRRGPLTSDALSYVAQGRRWVDIPWLFEAAAAGLYNLGAMIVPADPARADRIGVIALIAANALVRALTVLVLLGLRRPGPGLWWVAVCSALATGLLAGPAPLAPESWGMLLLAVELLLIHRAVDLEGRASAWALVPLFALWANLDASFLIGLLVLAAAAVGNFLGRPATPTLARGETARPPGATAAWPAVLAASALACLANPSTFRVFAVAASTLFANAFSPVWVAAALLVNGKSSNILAGSRDAQMVEFLAAGYLVFLAVGLASFAMNRRRFSWPRFLVFVVASALAGYSYVTFKGPFALVLAATLAMNGQEWYLDRFGPAGRTGRGWAAWSIGGRAVTIVLIFAALTLSLTGFGTAPGDPTFGFDANPDVFAFESAAFLGQSPIKGRVLNTNPQLGDALLWKARPNRRETFLDSREGLFTRDDRDELATARRALLGNKADVWRPILDRHRIDVVMLNINPNPNESETLGDRSGNTYVALKGSRDWVPFYDDGNVALFGRADAPEKEDLAFFEANRLDAQAMAFRREAPVPSTMDLPPTSSWLDKYFRGRALMPVQPHALAALRWLDPTTTYPQGPGPMSGGVATASGEGANGADAMKALDQDPRTQWQGPAPTGWLQYEFPGGRSYAVYRYSLTSAADVPGRDPKSWKLLGSDDGRDWTVLDTRADQTFSRRSQTNLYPVRNLTPHRMYRLEILANGGEPSLQLADWGLELVDVARPLVAVREARKAVASRPDGTASYGVLAQAYKALMLQEANVLAADESVSGGGLAYRMQQRVTALNFAIQATPPPITAEDRAALHNLNLELSQLYQVNGCFDLERDRLAVAIALVPPKDVPEEARVRLERLNSALSEVGAKLDEMETDPQAGPIQQANLAQNQGMVGLAIAKLEDVEKQGGNPAMVRARLVDLLCKVGQADKAQEILQQADLLDPALETDPGMSFYRHAKVNLLLGNYEVARELYRRAIARMRESAIRRALDTATSALLTGDPKGAVRAGLETPNLRSTQAAWVAELGLILLEAGEPRAAADALSQALALGPEVPFRALAAYDLQQMGHPVPGELPDDVFAK